MKRLLSVLALFAAACTGPSPSAPTGTQSAVSTAVQTPVTPVSGPGASGPAVDPTPGGPGNNATVPQYTMSGPNNPQNCFSPGPDVMRWLLTVTDAGPRHLRFIALAHQDETPGCEATAKNPRARMETSGVTDYTPHSRGTTTFSFDPRMYNCGRVQVDVSIFDAAGNETLILGTVINYGRQCELPPPVCSPASQSVQTGVPVSFAATGGNGAYAWASPGGTPASSSGSASHSTTYAAIGTYTTTLTSGGQTSTCTVTVTQTPLEPAVCSPQVRQTIAVGTPLTWTAINPTGGSVEGPFAWSVMNDSTTPATTAAPLSGNAASFVTTFSQTGDYLVRLSNRGRVSECPVTVTQEVPPLVCTPATTQVTQIGQLVNFLAIGGNGSYTWSAPGGTPAGAAPPANFSTSYSAAGNYTVTVSSAGQTATCPVTVQEQQTLACTPPSQQGQIGQMLNWSTTGNATGPFTWTAVGATTPSATGTNFSTSYPAPGSYQVTVTNGTITSQPCTVTIPQPPLVCTPPNQTAQIGQTVPFSASGGTGSYSWSAPGGSTTSGTGANFSTSYPAAGSYTATVTSGSQTQTCNVNVPPPPPSCVGVTARITDLLPPTGEIQVNVPAGQRANMIARIYDRTTETWSTYTELVTQSGQIHVPIGCFVKVGIYCGAITPDALLDAQEGPNTCAAQ